MICTDELVIYKVLKVMINIYRVQDELKSLKHVIDLTFYNNI